ncbi:hypothetical protein RN001_008013 [Aquatica leii]|uniref:Uncharacterized protein n=1 Tax=Aquatica leii TaxID=1421715 RepID=A0AAN7P955_9COLE|nr:hypothetical protein RN001_008013 [Aquatica leii]
MSFICSALAAILEPSFSVQEALEMILADDEDEFESDLFIAPPEPSLVSDEDSGDEDSGGDFNNFNRNQLLADAKLRPRILTDRLPDTGVPSTLSKTACVSFYKRITCDLDLDKVLISNL